MSKVILITGAASGIGAATARRAVAQGHQVAVADIDGAGAQALATALGTNAFAIALDIRSPQQWETALDVVWARFGRLDVLLNNAGIIHTGHARDVSLEQHRRTIEVNFLGPLTGMKAALPRFKAQGSGHFVTVCSMTAFVPMTGMASYAGSKHALRAFHHGMALEERDTPLHFTIVHPAATETPMLDAEAEDDSAVLAFSEKTFSADVVAETLLRAVDERPVEVVMPAVFGKFLRLFGANPGIMRRMIANAEAKGRKQLDARRKALKTS